MNDKARLACPVCRRDCPTAPLHANDLCPSCRAEKAEERQRLRESGDYETLFWDFVFGNGDDDAVAEAYEDATDQLADFQGSESEYHKRREALAAKLYAERCAS